MEMDRKKKGMLLLVMAGAVLLVVLVVFFVWSQSPSGKRGKEEGYNVYIDVQNAEEKPLEDSKIQSYRSRSNVEVYWDEMGEELSAETVAGEDPAVIQKQHDRDRDEHGDRDDQENVDGKQQCQPPGSSFFHRSTPL